MHSIAKSITAGMKQEKIGFLKMQNIPNINIEIILRITSSPMNKDNINIYIVFKTRPLAD